MCAYRSIALMVFVLTGACQATALADRTPSDKLMRGLENTLLGVLEIPRGMRVRTQEGIEEGTLVATAAIDGLVIGGVTGAVKAAGRVGSGLYDVVTFPFRPPGNYNSLIQPASLLSSAYWSYQPRGNTHRRTFRAPQ